MARPARIDYLFITTASWTAIECNHLNHTSPNAAILTCYYLTPGNVYKEIFELYS